MKNSFLGGTLLTIVVILWVASSTTIQHILSSYPKPYLLTYITTSMFSCCLLSLLWKRDKITKKSSPPLFKTGLFALKFCPLWFFANYFFNISLNLTSISSNTILSSTSGIFTLLFSVLFLQSSSSMSKWLAVLISFGGIVIIGLSEESGGSDSLIGDAFALCGAVMYAGYSVCLKEIGEVDIVLVFGCIGIINCVVLFPGIWFLHLAGIEKFEPPGDMEATLILANALVGSIICDLLWAWSVDCLTPTICTLGLSMTIPLSMAVDKYFTSADFNSDYMLGATFIVVGFVVITLADQEKEIAFVNEEVEVLIKNI